MDVAWRRWAIREAANFYALLADLRGEGEPAALLEDLALPLAQRTAILDGRDEALGYLAGRGFVRRTAGGWLSDWPPAFELVGVAPCADSGLSAWLRHRARAGGASEVNAAHAARRAGLILRTRDGRDREWLAKRIVFVCTDPDGAPLRLRGRWALNGGVPPGGLPKTIGFRVARTRDETGEPPAPDALFGLHEALALRRDQGGGRLVFVEGEADAWARLHAGLPSVALGGLNPGPARARALRRVLTDHGVPPAQRFVVPDAGANALAAARKLAPNLGARLLRPPSEHEEKTTGPAATGPAIPCAPKENHSATRG